MKKWIINLYPDDHLVDAVFTWGDLPDGDKLFLGIVSLILICGITFLVFRLLALWLFV